MRTPTLEEVDAFAEILRREKSPQVAAPSLSPRS